MFELITYFNGFQVGINAVVSYMKGKKAQAMN